MLSLLLCAALIFCLCACGAASEEDGAEPDIAQDQSSEAGSAAYLIKNAMAGVYEVTVQYASGIAYYGFEIV